MKTSQQRITQVSLQQLLHAYADYRQLAKRKVDETALDKMRDIEDYLWELIDG